MARITADLAEKLKSAFDTWIDTQVIDNEDVKISCSPEEFSVRVLRAKARSPLGECSWWWQLRRMCLLKA